jgi:hypothetical protein
MGNCGHGSPSRSRQSTAEVKGGAVWAWSLFQTQSIGLLPCSIARPLAMSQRQTLQPLALPQDGQAAILLIQRTCAIYQDVHGHCSHLHFASTASTSTSHDGNREAPVPKKSVARSGHSIRRTFGEQIPGTDNSDFSKCYIEELMDLLFRIYHIKTSKTEGLYCLSCRETR